VTIAASQYFSREASRELRSAADSLRSDTEKVRKYVNALITYLEGSKVISRVPRDEQQNIWLEGIAPSEQVRGEPHIDSERDRED